MSGIEMAVWCVLVLTGLIAAGMGAGLETGVYSLNRVRLHVLQHQANTSARLMAKQLAAPAALIASLLIGHNLGVKLATHAAAMLLSARHLTEWQIVTFDALIMMPLLFIFAETLPKDLFSLHADRILYPFVRPMAALVRVCRYTGLLPLIMGASRLAMWMLGIRDHPEPFHPRYHVQTLVREGVGHGLLSGEQLAIVERVLALGDQGVADVMTPWKQVIKVRIDDAPDVLWDLASQTNRSRFPVVDGAGQVRGLVNLYDALVHENDQCPPIESMVTPTETSTENASLRDTLAQLQESRSAMTIVVDRRNRPIGIATIKDLVEPITGELVNW